jgi:hypothetical protein
MRQIRYDACMSKTSTKPRLRCTSVDFIEIECQRPIVPRLVIRLTQGITILMESSADFPLACEFISTLRSHDSQQGGRP